MKSENWLDERACRGGELGEVDGGCGGVHNGGEDGGEDGFWWGRRKEVGVKVYGVGVGVERVERRNGVMVVAA